MNLTDPIKVLDDGFVRYVDHMGSDEAIEQAARISYSGGAEDRKRSETRGLLRYLMRHRHTTPYEMAELKFHVRVPMDCWRQWIRHRTANVNEYSTRYSEAIDSMAKTKPDEWRAQSKSNKQGSELDSKIDNMVKTALSKTEADFHKKATELYKDRLDYGIAREQARKDLPLSTYTEAYWKIDLHNLFHFLSLRMDSHAQYEIRMYANAIAKFVECLFPISWEAFVDYRLEGMFLTRLDIKVLKDVLIEMKRINPAVEVDSHISNKREREECIQKLQRLGFIS